MKFRPSVEKLIFVSLLGLITITNWGLFVVVAARFCGMVRFFLRYDCFLCLHASLFCFVYVLLIQ